MQKSTQTALSLLIIIAGIAAVFALSGFLEKNRPPLPAGLEDSDLAVQGARLKGYALGAEGLIADWYWMQSLQYIGNKILKNPEKTSSIDNMRELNPRLLYPYLDNATTLDPHFTAPYEYGANVLPAIDSNQAVTLLEKGIANNPDQWRLYHFLGYTYWKLENYAKAAELYEQGAKVKNAPAWMPFMSAKMKSEGGSRDTARAIYRQMYETAADSQTRENADFRLKELASLDERDAIDKALVEFKDKTSRCASNWREILPLLKTVRLPEGRDFMLDNNFNLVDPGGVPYELDKEKCTAKLGAESKILGN